MPELIVTSAFLQQINDSELDDGELDDGELDVGELDDGEVDNGELDDRAVDYDDESPKFNKLQTSSMVLSQFCQRA